MPTPAFNATLRAFIDAVIRQIILEVHNRAVLYTPVDTGSARQGWRWDFGRSIVFNRVAYARYLGEIRADVDRSGRGIRRSRIPTVPIEILDYDDLPVPLRRAVDEVLGMGGQPGIQEQIVNRVLDSGFAERFRRI